MVTPALERELKALPAGVRSSALAEVALVLAGLLDDSGTSASAKVRAAGGLAEILEQLTAKPADVRKPDRLDDLRGRRESRGPRERRAVAS